MTLHQLRNTESQQLDRYGLLALAWLAYILFRYTPFRQSICPSACVPGAAHGGNRLVGHHLGIQHRLDICLQVYYRPIDNLLS